VKDSKDTGKKKSNVIPINSKEKKKGLPKQTVIPRKKGNVGQFEDDPPWSWRLDPPPGQTIIPRTRVKRNGGQNIDGLGNQVIPWMN